MLQKSHWLQRVRLLGSINSMIAYLLWKSVAPTPQSEIKMARSIHGSGLACRRMLHRRNRKCGLQQEHGGLGGDSHTHTAPPRPVTKAPLHRLWGRGGMTGHDTDSRATDAAARILCAEIPVPLIVLAVIMAANRRHPVAIWAGRNAQWTISPLRRGCGSFISGATWQLGEVRRQAAGLRSCRHRHSH